MPNKRDIVGAAFSELGIGSWEFDLQPDEIQDAINRLDAMMAKWSSQGIRIGYNSSDPDPDAPSGIPDVALEAVRTNLALRLAAPFMRQVNPQTVTQAAEGFTYLSSYFFVIPKRQLPNTLPLGAGNRAYTASTLATFFPPSVDEVAVGPDSILGLNP